MIENNGNKVLQRITEIFIIAIVIIFPLCVDKTGFFRILECKYRSFLIINTLYISAIIITLIYYWMFKKENLLKGLKLSKLHWSAIVFWIINLISTIASPFYSKYNLFVGVGRAEGLISITLYTLSFLNITLFGKFKRRYILYFSISAIILNLISIIQYIGFNPFNMYQDGIGTHNVSFIGTIGNIDFVSATYCILLTVSMAAYLFLEDNKKYEKIIYLIAVYMGFFILEILDVLSGTVGFGLTLFLTSPFIITNSKRLSRLLMIGSMIVLGYAANLIINPTFYYDIGKIVLKFQMNTISIILLIATTILMFLSHIVSKRDFDISNNKNIIKAFYLVAIFAVIVILVGIYFIPANSGLIYEVHEILHGNLDDDFGTYRMFLCKRAITLVKEYPIIGTGPDTFAVRFMEKYTQDVIKIGELSINDTAANSYLTMLVNIGILGLLSYLTFIILQIINSLKNSNKYSIIFLVAFICFLIQDFFNLWVVIVIPIFWVLMAILYLSIQNKCTNEMGEKNE